MEEVSVGWSLFGLAVVAGFFILALRGRKRGSTPVRTPDAVHPSDDSPKDQPPKDMDSYLRK